MDTPWGKEAFDLSNLDFRKNEKPSGGSPSSTLSGRYVPNAGIEGKEMVLLRTEEGLYAMNRLPGIPLQCFTYTVGGYHTKRKVDNFPVFVPTRIFFAIDPMISLPKEILEGSRPLDEVVSFLRDPSRETPPLLKFIACHTEIRILGQPSPALSYDSIYPLGDLLELPLPTLISLYEKIKEDPFPLALHSPSGLPLISLRKYDELVRLGKRPRDYDFKRKVIFILEKIHKRFYEDGDKAIPLSEIPTEILTLLLEEGVLYKYPSHPYVTLPQIERWESFFPLLLKKMATPPPPFTVPPEKLRTFRGHSLCSEQEAALELIKKHSIVGISGQAGGGKTDELAVLKYVYTLPQIMASAWQGNNVATLAGMFVGAKTIHKILYSHKYSCSSGGKCCFSEVKLLIIDEVFLLSLPLFAKLVACLLLCASSLERIILIGDPKQLAPIEKWRASVDLFKYLKEKGQVIEFLHIHRSGGAGVIARNARIISEGGSISDLVFGDSFILVPPNGDYVGTLRRVLEEHSVPQRSSNVMTRTNAVRKELLPMIEEYYGQRKGFINVGQKVSVRRNLYEVGLYTNKVFFFEGYRDVPISSQPLRDLYSRAPPGNTHLGFIPKGRIRIIKLVAEDETIYANYADVKEYLKPASVTTVNGFQGNETDVALYVLPFCCPYETKERLYTVITRARKKVILIMTVENLAQIMTQEEPEYFSLLYDLLKME